MPVPQKPAFKRLLFDNPKHFAELRDLLVDLTIHKWSKEETYFFYSANNLKPGYFWQNGKVLTVWHSILAEAIELGVAEALVDNVLVRYQDEDDLRVQWDQLRRFVAKNGIPKPIVRAIDLKEPETISVVATDPKKLAALRTALTELYETEPDAIRISSDAGIDHRELRLDTTGVNRWHTILQQTIKQGLLETLINTVRKEYPGRGAYLLGDDLPEVLPSAPQD